MPEKQTYVALLRGINVGGHHKVPMAGLKKEMEQMGFDNIRTLLNSGNVIFEGKEENEASLEKRIATRLEKVFGFPVPVLLRTGGAIAQLIDSAPFKGITVTKDTRLYVSFVKKEPSEKPELPWISEDGSYRILRVDDRIICSVLDVSVTKTPKAMEALERFFGKDITTRNWNTVEKIGEKMK